jgi:hypothetical protein
MKKNIIDFYGCSFTEGPILQSPLRYGELDIIKYLSHTQNTKTTSGFLDFDLAYNSNAIDEYEVNNYGKGSFGNFTIGNVLENKTRQLDKQNNNIAIVQLSAIIRNEHSLESVVKQKDNYKGMDEKVFNLDYERIKPDYIAEDNTMRDFYMRHISNLERICDTLSENYNNFIIFFGWDITTSEFFRLFKKSKVSEIIKTFEYNYPLSNIEFFGNSDNFNYQTKIYHGNTGGLLDYSSNFLPEELRYVGGKSNDQHPSYFSNKIFYNEIIRPFLAETTSLIFDNSYFKLESIIKFEKCLEELLIKKRRGSEWENYTYEELYHELIRLNRGTKNNNII